MSNLTQDKSFVRKHLKALEVPNKLIRKPTQADINASIATRRRNEQLIARWEQMPEGSEKHLRGIHLSASSII